VSQYVEYQNKIFIPVQVVEVSFCEKNEITLNAFQKFILEAVDSGNSVNQIVDATLFTTDVVETEIVQMVNQKLLIREGDNIMLSELSKKIRMISRNVVSLNKEKKKVCINLVTGDIEAFDMKSIVSDKHEKELFMTPNFLIKDFDGINLEENTTFFEKYMDSFYGMLAEDIETVLSSIFVELKAIGKEQYIEKAICRIPCKIGGNILQSNVEDLIKAKGAMYRVEYKVESELVNNYGAVVSELMNINRIDNELLSEKGQDVLEKYKVCEEYNIKKIVCFYDVISGQFRFDSQEIKLSKNERYNLQLPILYDLSNDVKHKITKKIRECYGISDEFIVKEIACEKANYIVDCEVSDLWGAEYGEC
jgi:hypothetical protein